MSEKTIAYTFPKSENADTLKTFKDVAVKLEVFTLQKFT